ncbi:MAG: metallophosphoesterase [Thaumarchaeota archaeon]|nr:metallophosphoesterase [Nitrososphaerota archaeon]
MGKTRLFFVTDVHGSDRCFRKFVNAGKFYHANALILGGDITGKMIVVIVKKPDGTYQTDYTGEKVSLKPGLELEAMVKNIKDVGYYPYVCEQKDVGELNARPELVTETFNRLMVEDVRRWVNLAEERLKGTGIQCYISPGNDDILEIDKELSSSTVVENPEEKVVSIDGRHEMITLGTTNRTPWHSPREVDEEVLERKIDVLAAQVKEMSEAIFNVHVPPKDTAIDQAPKLDESLAPVTSGGQIVIAPAGSAACRNSILKHQPLMGLHGHIHESRGLVKLGRTLCFNPGSEYGEGILRGLLCDIERDQIKSYLLTSG